MNKPTTADQIREAIQHSKNIQLLEQLTIDALTRDLEKMETSLGKVDRLFVKTKDIDRDTIGPV